MYTNKIDMFKQNRHPYKEKQTCTNEIDMYGQRQAHMHKNRQVHCTMYIQDKYELMKTNM